MCRCVVISHTVVDLRQTLELVSCRDEALLALTAAHRITTKIVNAAGGDDAVTLGCSRRQSEPSVTGLAFQMVGLLGQCLVSLTTDNVRGATDAAFDLPVTDDASSALRENLRRDEVEVFLAEIDSGRAYLAVGSAPESREALAADQVVGQFRRGDVSLTIIDDTETFALIGGRPEPGETKVAKEFGRGEGAVCVY